MKQENPDSIPSVVKAKNTGALGTEEEVAIVFRIILMISSADLHVACRREFPVMLESRNTEERVGPNKGSWILTIPLGVPRSLDPGGEEVTQRLDGIIPGILADDLEKTNRICAIILGCDEKNISRWRKYLAMLRWSSTCQFH